jgi:hypothetical protein
VIGAFILAGTLAAMPPAEAQIRFFDTALIEGETITLKQVADLRDLPTEWRLQAEGLTLQKWDRKRPAASLDHAALASRVRALMPALASWLRGPFDGSMRVTDNRGTQRLPLAACGEDGLDKGDAVTIQIAAGPFQIERETIALQPAKPGERLFVKTADGDALAVQCAGAD